MCLPLVATFRFANSMVLLLSTLHHFTNFITMHPSLHEGARKRLCLWLADALQRNHASSHTGKITASNVPYPSFFLFISFISFFPLHFSYFFI